MKLGNVVGMQPALKTLSETKLPVKAGYRVAKALKLVAAELMTYDASRVKLLEQYGKLSEDKKQYTFEGPTARADFDRDFAVLMDEEVTIEVLPLEIEDLGDAAIEPNVIFPLIGFLIKD